MRERVRREEGRVGRITWWVDRGVEQDRRTEGGEGKGKKGRGRHGERCRGELKMNKRVVVSVVIASEEEMS
jgi:hypothetical protein